jgi:hypothetical protein
MAPLHVGFASADPAIVFVMLVRYSRDLMGFNYCVFMLILAAFSCRSTGVAAAQGRVFAQHSARRLGFHFCHYDVRAASATDRHVYADKNEQARAAHAKVQRSIDVSGNGQDARGDGSASADR